MPLSSLWLEHVPHRKCKPCRIMEKNGKKHKLLKRHRDCCSTERNLYKCVCVCVCLQTEWRTRISQAGVNSWLPPPNSIHLQEEERNGQYGREYSWRLVRRHLEQCGSRELKASTVFFGIKNTFPSPSPALYFFVSFSNNLHYSHSFPPFFSSPTPTVVSSCRAQHTHLLTYHTAATQDTGKVKENLHIYVYLTVDESVTVLNLLPRSSDFP